MPCDIGEIDTCQVVVILGCEKCPHDLTPFERKCPHFESREHMRRTKSCISPPEDKRLHWCGDKGEWIKKCDSLCGRLNLLNNMLLRQQQEEEIITKQKEIKQSEQDIEDLYEGIDEDTIC